MDTNVLQYNINLKKYMYVKDFFIFVPYLILSLRNDSSYLRSNQYKNFFHFFYPIVNLFNLSISTLNFTKVFKLSGTLKQIVRNVHKDLLITLFLCDLCLTLKTKTIHFNFFFDILYLIKNRCYKNATNLLFFYVAILYIIFCSTGVLKGGCDFRKNQKMKRFYHIPYFENQKTDICVNQRKTKKSNEYHETTFLP